MDPTLRKILAESHIGAVACVVLLWRSLDMACRAFWAPFYHLTFYVATAIAIWDIPYSSMNGADKVEVILTLEHFLYALAYLAAAWMISRWLYGVGPIRSLRAYRERTAGRGNA